MKMPTIHLILEEGKSACGKKKGIGTDLKEFKKKMKDVFPLGLCNSCMAIAKKEKK